MLKWLTKWYNYMMRNECPKCSHKLVERLEKHLNNKGKVDYTTPVNWCSYCGNKIYMARFWSI